VFLQALAFACASKHHPSFSRASLTWRSSKSTLSGLLS
jgi:hypothetical protein